jgi:hypothetical protein
VGDPARRFNAHRRRPDQGREVGLKALDLLGADPPFPLVAQFAEDSFACSHDFEAERRDLKAFAPGVERIGTACHAT